MAFLDLAAPRALGFAAKQVAFVNSRDPVGGRAAQPPSDEPPPQPVVVGFAPGDLRARPNGVRVIVDPQIALEKVSWGCRALPNVFWGGEMRQRGWAAKHICSPGATRHPRRLPPW